MMESHKPTFAIMGSGGMGGYIGASLARAGYTTSFVARGAHLASIQGSGLRIEGPSEEYVLQPITVASDPKELEPVDFVIFCVKLWDTETAGALCRDLIGPETAVLSMQNGVEPEPVLSDILGRKHVMGAVAEVGANIVEPGLLQHVPSGIVVAVTLADPPPERTQRIQALLLALTGNFGRKGTGNLDTPPFTARKTYAEARSHVAYVQFVEQLI